jgi:hypothetical protein
MVPLRLWFLLLSIALFCLWVEDFINNIFSDRREKQKKRKKKECLSGNEVEVVCQGLLKKILPEAKRRCGDFF